MLSNVRLQIKLTKARSSFYLMNKDKESKVIFKYTDAHLLVKRVRPNPAILAAHNQTKQGDTREIQLYESRTQDFHILERFQVSLDRQCRVGNHPKTTDFYDDKEQTF